MSWQALDWVRKQHVGHAHSKAVLVQLANYADEHGSCYPSNEYLAKQVEVSERTIQDCVKRLERERYVSTKRDRNEKGQLTITRYQLCTHRMAATEGDQPPEAASGGDHRKTGANPPEADAPATGSSFRLDTPKGSTKRTIERDARASEKQKNLPNADLLEELIRAHPQSAHDQSADIEAAWRRLTPAERREAVARIADWLASRGGRRAIAGLPAYLGDRMWMRLAPVPGTAAATGEVFIEAFSRAWWSLFHRFVEVNREQLKDPDSQASQQLIHRTSIASSMAIGWPVPVERKPVLEEQARALVSVPADSAEAAHWRRHYRETGVDMPIPDKPGVWVFLPAAIAVAPAQAEAGA